MAKLTVEFTGTLHDTVTNLATTEGVTKTEILRRAIALYAYVLRETQTGNRLSITDGDKRVTDIVLV